MPIKSLKKISLSLALVVPILIFNLQAFAQVRIQSVEGIFEHQVSCDFNHGLEKQHYYLKDTTTNKVRKLIFPNKPPSSLKTGSRVRLTGNVSASQIEVTESSMSAMQFEATDMVESAVTGDRKMLVFLANFITPNGTVNLTCSNAQIKDTFFDNPSSINKYYQAASFHDPARNSFGVSFSGTVVGPYNIQYNPTTCDPTTIANLIKTAAQSAGVNIGNYNHYVYLYPYVEACGFAGLGTVGGNPASSWINGYCDELDITAHEIGHNLSMRHAAAGTLTGYNAGDTLYQYRDYSDIMGIGGLGLRLLNAGHMEQMGWTPTSQILTITGNGTFQIAPLATFPADTTLPTILKIRKPDTSEYFYISYRRRMGFDANLDNGYVDKVNIHRYAGGGVLSYFIKALADGESLQDPTNNIVITMNSHNNTSATVSINSLNSPASPMQLRVNPN